MTSSPLKVVKDIFGFEWGVEVITPTEHGFSVLRGRKVGVRGGAAVIITRELAQFISTHSYTQTLNELPIGATALKRIIAKLDKANAHPVIDLTVAGRLYNPPVCKRGDVLRDYIAGDVIVGGFIGGDYPWVYRKDTGTFILCGDLITAVKTESATDIAKWYGVSPATIAKWRKALGVTRCNNLGTFRLICQKSP